MIFEWFGCIIDVVVDDFVRLLGCSFPFNALPVPMLRQVFQAAFSYVFVDVFCYYERSLATQGSYLAAQGSSLAAQGSSLGAQGSCLGAQGSHLAAQGSYLVAQGSHLAAQGSYFGVYF